MVALLGKSGDANLGGAKKDIKQEPGVLNPTQGP